MAVPMARPSALRSPPNLVLLALCLALGAASLLRSGQLLVLAQTAIDGLAIHEVSPAGVDAADLPAMEPLLARVVDPRPQTASVPESRPRRAAIQPFAYDVRSGDTLFDVATRFGVSLSAMLWNNGLESPDEVPAGQRLLVLPVSGVIHTAQAGETALAVAERYAVAVVALIEANDLEGPGALAPGRVLVVPGGAVPTPTPRLAPTAVPWILVPVPTATVVALLPATPAATAEPDHAARIAAALADPDPSLAAPSNASPHERAFILSLATAARESQRATGVPASVTLAQAILESDWGRSRLAREAKNLFGIKARTRPGTAGVFDIRAWEVIGGANVYSPEAFKAYLTIADSIVDHGRWFHDQPRYAGALAVRDDPRAFARAINAAGYATDPAYATKLIALMDRFELYAYDLD